MKFISWEEAKAHGLKRYFIGTTCCRGHRCERTIWHRCVECQKITKARWIKNNPNYHREYERQWLTRGDNRDKRALKNRERMRLAYPKYKETRKIKDLKWREKRRIALRILEELGIQL